MRTEDAWRRARLLKVGLVLVAALVLSVAAAACGGGSSSSGPSETGGNTEPPSSENASKGEGSSEAEEATGAPIKIGTLYSATGAAAPSIAMPEVYGNWEKLVNEEGGINGHPVELIAKDDAQNPAKASVIAREMVEQDHVVAFAGSTTNASADIWSKYAVEKKVPVIGPEYWSFNQYSDPLVYPVGGSFIAMLIGLMETLEREGVKNASAISCSETPACAAAGGIQEGITKEIVTGVNFVASVKAASTSPSFAAPCLTIKSKGAEEFYLGFANATSLRIVEECSRQNTGAAPAFSSGGVGFHSAGSTGMEGAYLILPTLSIAATEGPGAERLKAVIGSAIENEQISDLASGAIAGLEMFKVAAEIGHLTPSSTSADVIKSLDKVKNETLGGLTAPVTYEAGKTTMLTCYYAARAEGGSWVSNDKYHCAKPEDVEKTLASIG